ncbi:MAG TPA: TetR/AcrR family transcriptional regulator [Vitreimonas sp.]|nr:TetR/AcrR family transcriptional regulator [Vitreimonas sp.]
MGGAAASQNAGNARTQDRGVARRQAFLQAAREVFLEQGYEAASVNDVVRRAGGSLATLYAQFGNKEGLFFAVLQDQHERFTRAITPDSVDHLPLEAGLQAIGERYVCGLLTRENISFYRIMIGEARKFPEQTRRYFSTGGADKVTSVLAGFLRARGVMTADPEFGASLLQQYWRSRHHYRAVVDDSYRVSEKEIAEHVARSVEFFLNGAMPRT